MLFDYLRYLAFEGELRNFYEDGIYQYAKPDVVTGAHLRYGEDFLQNVTEFGYGRFYFPSSFDPFYRLSILQDVLAIRFGIRQTPREFDFEDGWNAGKTPTHRYSGERPPGIEIILDVHPNSWHEGYTERSSYEGIPILFRRSGPARGDLSSGDRLFHNENRHKFGTLCGLLHSHQRNESYALTCGHVAAGSTLPIQIGSGTNFLTRLFRPSLAQVGQLIRADLPSENKHTIPMERIDGALYRLPEPKRRADSALNDNYVRVAAISELAQEELVEFVGATRKSSTTARLAAVTVWKSMDLLRDGQLRNVGDVMMLGHKKPVYFNERLTRPGDSGAAVRRPSQLLNGNLMNSGDWLGMILGSDDCGGYATYSEYLLAWARKRLDDPNLDFRF